MSDYAGSVCKVCGEEITETEAINNEGICGECEYELNEIAEKHVGTI